MPYELVARIMDREETSRIAIDLMGVLHKASEEVALEDSKKSKIKNGSSDPLLYQPGMDEDSDESEESTEEAEKITDALRMCGKGLNNLDRAKGDGVNIVREGRGVLHVRALVNGDVTARNSTICAAIVDDLPNNVNTPPETLLRIWERTGIYAHDPRKPMKNVFPKGSLAHMAVNAANDIYFDEHPNENRNEFIKS